MGKIQISRKYIKFYTSSRLKMTKIIIEIVALDSSKWKSPPDLNVSTNTD